MCVIARGVLLNVPYPKDKQSQMKSCHLFEQSDLVFAQVTYYSISVFEVGPVLLVEAKS